MEIKELEEQLKQVSNRIKKLKSRINYGTFKRLSRQETELELSELIKHRKEIKANLSKLRTERHRQKQAQKYVRHNAHNDYAISGNVAVFTTVQKKPVKFIVDVKDVDIVLKKRWHAHKCSRGDVYIVNRTCENGKWKMESLLHALGYNKNYTFVNGNKFDFRRSNICMKKYIVEKYVAKTTNEDR